MGAAVGRSVTLVGHWDIAVATTTAMEHVVLGESTPRR